MTRPRWTIATDIGVAALLIGLSLLTAFARQLGITDNPDIGIRLVNIIIGLVLARYGNVVPKQLVPYQPDSDRPARRQACLRFCAWAFVLGGLAYAATWAILPVDDAAFWGMLPLAGAMIVVGIRIALTRARARRA